MVLMVMRRLYAASSIERFAWRTGPGAEYFTGEHELFATRDGSIYELPRVSHEII